MLFVLWWKEDIYPDPSQNYFRAALSKYLGVPANCIVGGSGSDDNIDILIRLVDPHTILITTPTFGMYSFLGKIDKARIVDVPRLPNTFGMLYFYYCGYSLFIILI